MGNLTQYIVVNKGLKMGCGKICAQVAHASVSALDKVDDSDVSEWKNEGMKKVVLKAKNTEEMLALFERAKKELPCTLITDAGHTQIEPGSKTCFGCGPVEEEKANKYFKDLKLL